MTAGRGKFGAAIAAMLAVWAMTSAQAAPDQDRPPHVQLWAQGQWLQDGRLGSYCWFDGESESCQVVPTWLFPSRVQSASRDIIVRVKKIEPPSEIGISKVKGRGRSARYTPIRAIAIPADDGSGWDFNLQLESDDSGTLNLLVEAHWPDVNQCPPCGDEFAEWRFRVAIPND